MFGGVDVCRWNVVVLVFVLGFIIYNGVGELVLGDLVYGVVGCLCGFVIVLFWLGCFCYWYFSVGLWLVGVGKYCWIFC